MGPSVAGEGPIWTVKPGDTLGDIAAATGCSLKQLNSAAITDPDAIQAGWVISLCSAAAPAEESPPPVGPRWTVKPGDTLSAIAAVTGCSAEQLLALNSAASTDADNIEAGWVLDLYNRLISTAEPEYPELGPTWTVKPGDTLSSIAAATGCSMEQLLARNSALIKDPEEIEVGWVLDLCSSTAPAGELGPQAG
ncbi:hypothetical protein N2152v2_011043 [Parachlorella kessleri]